MREFAQYKQPCQKLDITLFFASQGFIRSVEKAAVSSICVKSRVAAPGVVSSAGTQKTPLCPGEHSPLICVWCGLFFPCFDSEEKKRVFHLNTLNSEEQIQYSVRGGREERENFERKYYATLILKMVTKC